MIGRKKTSKKTINRTSRRPIDRTNRTTNRTTSSYRTEFENRNFDYEKRAKQTKATREKYERKKQRTKKEGFVSGLTKKSTLGELDFTFLTLVILIVCAGLIMVFSASAPRALRLYDNSFRFFQKQFFAAIIGFVVMIVISKIDYKRYEGYVGFFMIGCLFLLALVAIPGVGIMRNGSRRWLPFPGGGLQPSEFMKPVIAMFIANIIQRKKYDPKTLKGAFKIFAWVIITIGLMILEPHVSGAVVICGIAATVIIVGGIKMLYLIIGGVIVIPAGIFYVLHDPVRSKRLAVAFNPFLDKMGTGYQSAQGLYAIASGGLFGRGLGQSIQKAAFLPEPYNDFIFAVICEELGLLGAILTIALFIALIVRGVKIALKAPDTFSCLTVVGIMAHIGIQVLFNILVVTCIIPNTGITLPFFSYGGTALVVLMAEMGIVLGISRKSKI